MPDPNDNANAAPSAASVDPETQSFLGQVQEQTTPKPSDDNGDPSDGSPAPQAAQDPQNPQNPPNPSNSQDSQTFMVKVNGEDREVTLEELQQGYSKAAGADARFQQAAQLRQEAAEAMQLQQLLLSARDMEKPLEERTRALEKASILLGDDPQAVREYYERLSADVEGDEGEEGGDPNMSPQNPAQNPAQNERPSFNRDDLPEDVQQDLEYARQARAREHRERIHGILDQAVDNDPILSQNSSEAIEAAKKLAKNEVQRRVLVARESFNPDLVADVIQNIRSTLRHLGARPKGSAENPNDDGAQFEQQLEGLLNIGGHPEQPVSGASGLQASEGQGSAAGSAHGQSVRSGQGRGEDGIPNITDTEAWDRDFLLRTAKKTRELERRQS